MQHSIETLSALNNRDEVHDIIHEFYTFQSIRLHADGGPAISPDAPVKAFWDSLDSYFPPQGALVLARAESGHVIGCGALTDVGDGIGEMKYLYVKPEARGTGLGRALVEARIDIARKMGLSQLCVDTLKASVEMHCLYNNMGFERVTSFPQSKSLRDFEELTPFLYFFKMDLTPAAQA